MLVFLLLAWIALSIPVALVTGLIIRRSEPAPMGQIEYLEALYAAPPAQPNARRLSNTTRRKA